MKTLGDYLAADDNVEQKRARERDAALKVYVKREALKGAYPHQSPLLAGELADAEREYAVACNNLNAARSELLDTIVDVVRQTPAKRGKRS